MPDQRPNVLLIMTDQFRADCIGLDPHSPDALQTPNIDWLAKSGTHFRRGYSESPTCIPARRSLMSGMAPATHGVVGFEDAEWNPPHTLAGELSDAGYQTEMIGKLHLHPKRKRYGFDHMQLAESTRGDPNDYEDWLKQRHGRTETDPGMTHGLSSNGWGGRPHTLPEEQMHTFWVVNQAMEFLKKRDPSTPFFLNISFIDPHPPFTPPASYYNRYVERDLPAPVVGDWAREHDGQKRGYHRDTYFMDLPEHDIHTTRAAYYGMINFIDDQLGRLFQFARWLHEDTLIVLSADHGEMLGDHHRFRKLVPYEASARIPYIVRAPGDWGIPHGAVCESPVGLQDVMPTILDAVGLDVPDSCTGKSLMPVVRGEATGVRDVLHGEHSGDYTNDHGHQFLTDDRYKYIWHTQTGREHLFDLGEDPLELHDIAMEPDAESKLEPWRNRMVDVLDGRPEGFTDGEKLITGQKHVPVMPGYDPDQPFPFL